MSMMRCTLQPEHNPYRGSKHIEPDLGSELERNLQVDEVYYEITNDIAMHMGYAREQDFPRDPKKDKLLRKEMIGHLSLPLRVAVRGAIAKDSIADRFRSEATKQRRQQEENRAVFPAVYGPIGGLVILGMFDHLTDSALISDTDQAQVDIRELAETYKAGLDMDRFRRFTGISIEHIPQHVDYVATAIELSPVFDEERPWIAHGRRPEGVPRAVSLLQIPKQQLVDISAS